jgi:2-C-methyl-D-erythritol 4-phosphate cytidylyltransferase
LFTDDASVVQKYGKSLSYIMGERLNIKITTQEDLLLAKAVMSLRDND